MVAAKIINKKTNYEKPKPFMFAYWCIVWSCKKEETKLEKAKKLLLKTTSTECYKALYEKDTINLKSIISKMEKLQVISKWKSKICQQN
jgi:hypothetical protein